MVDVSEAFRKFTRHRPRDVGTGCRVLLQKKVRLPGSPPHLSFQVDEKACIEKKSAHPHGLSGGESRFCASSSKRITSSSAAGMDASAESRPPQVFFPSSHTPRRITCEKESRGCFRAAFSFSYATRSIEIVFVAMHAAYTGGSACQFGLPMLSRRSVRSVFQKRRRDHHPQP